MAGGFSPALSLCRSELSFLTEVLYGRWVPDIEPSAATAGWLPELPIGQGAVEKLRTDLPGGGSVHALESRRGVQVAAIGSGYFIDGYWEGDHPKTLPQVKAMLRELYERCGESARWHMTKNRFFSSLRM
jgi:hypothetical protein